MRSATPTEASRLSAALEANQSLAKKLQESHAVTEDLQHQYGRELMNKAKELETWQSQCNMLNQRQGEIEGRWKNSAEENRKLQSQCLTEAEQLRAKDTEIASLKAFLSTHNTSSDEDVGEMLERINNLTEDLPTRTAELVMEPVAHVHPGQFSLSETYSNVRKRLGGALAEMLHRSSQKDACASFLLQFAWQATILSQVHGIIVSFSACYPETEEYEYGDKVLRALASTIESEGTYTNTVKTS